MNDTCLKRKKAGFTLIETLVAVAILALAVAGPLVVATRALFIAQTSRDQLTAVYLAQEGVEYVRTMRDDAYLARYTASDPSARADAWSDFTTPGSSFSIANCISSVCTLDPIDHAMGFGGSNALQSCGGGGCTPLYLSAGVYKQDSTGGTKTVFTRTLWATAVGPNEERVTCTVTWDSHGTTLSETVTEQFTPWE